MVPQMSIRSLSNYADSSWGSGRPQRRWNQRYKDLKAQDIHVNAVYEAIFTCFAVFYEIYEYFRDIHVCKYH